MVQFNIEVPVLGEYDVAVCGGGIAGFAAAVSAARLGMNVVLIENSGYLGGIMTQTMIPLILDADNKGGIVREMLNFLQKYKMTCPRRGKRVSEDGEKLPGNMIDLEGAKFFFDKLCREAGVKVLFYSRIVHANLENDRIKSILISTDGGNYAVHAKVFIDATGNGVLASMAGCDFEIGEPNTGKPQAMSMTAIIGGYPESFDSIDSEEEKTQYHNMLEKHGIKTSAGQIALAKLPSLHTWYVWSNLQFDVRIDDIFSISDATMEGRKENFETIMQHSKIKGYENMFLVSTSDHIGVREGRRILGCYRITLNDIINGARFEDGICLVRFGVDVHKLMQNDTLDNSRGYKIKPYHIPYRSLVPIKTDNLLLAGRCISGDFYPHASYRVMGNMAATGEAAGFAAYKCAVNNILPREVDGREVSEFMKEKGYEI